MDENRPNIVFVVLDTARAANLSLHGYTPQTTPNLERIADQSTVYEQAISPSPWTLPSHASLLSGLYPSTHGTTRSNPQFMNNVELLPSLLRKHGYKNTLISANKILFQDTVLGEAFDTSVNTMRRYPTGTPENYYVEAREKYRGLDASTFKSTIDFGRHDETTLKDFANLAHRFWHNRIRDGQSIRSGANNVIEFKKVFEQDGPHFTLVNFMDTHLRYEPEEYHLREILPSDISLQDLHQVNQDSRTYNYTNSLSMSEEDFRRLKILYNGTYRTVDQYVGEIYDYLVKTNQFEDTLFVVLGDHGEHLGEYGMMGHSLSLSDYLCHVPLIISYPGQDSRKRVEQIVQIHDLFYTVVELLGLTLNGELTNPTDTYQLPRTDSGDTRSFAVAEYLGSPFKGIEQLMEEHPEVDYSKYDYELKTIYDTDGHKYTIKSTGKECLRDVDTDTELSVDQHSELVSNLRNELFHHVPEFDSARSSSYESNIETTLKDLGYI